MNRGILIGVGLLLVLAVIWLFSDSAPEPISAGRIVNGKAYRDPANGAVYMIVDNTKRWYINAAVYARHGSPPATTASSADLNAIPSGANYV